MSFVDRDFAWFLPAALALWWLVRRNYPWQIGVMLAVSLVFYGYGRWWVLCVLTTCCAVDWIVARLLHRARRPRLVLGFGIGFNLAVLCFWKYTPLLVRSFDGMPSENWVVPMGVSFYAFTGIAYMTDVYRGILPAESNFWRYSLFASFFPHLVAGPILRTREFLTDLRPESMPAHSLAPAEGALLIARGYFKKLILADGIAAAVDPFFANLANSSTSGVWSLLYVYLYAFQIYFDFSGYTDIARGLGLWFGFRWPENFNSPYAATSVQDFWRRWHMTLSRFLRDYVYIPLGGNRIGPARSTVNLMVTMMLGGLWHGANWSFLVWGGLHGLLLALNRLWGTCPLQMRLARLSGLPGLAWRITRILLTFNAVCLAWCFFRLPTLHESLVCIRKIFYFDHHGILAGGVADGSLWMLLAAYGTFVATVQLAARKQSLTKAVERWHSMPFAGGILWGGSAGFLALSLLLARGGDKTPFIYFQF